MKSFSKIKEAHNKHHGMFKAIFVSGGPGSGKDLVIREAITEKTATEINATLAISILRDKHRLSEHSKDFRREAIRNRSALIINGTTTEYENICAIKEELEELGYETMMVFVNTSNESSQKRNAGLERMLDEEVRLQRWTITQQISEIFNEQFSKYLEFDNSLDLSEATKQQKIEKQEDIAIISEMSKWFFGMPITNEIAELWLYKNKKINVNSIFEQIINRKENYVSENQTDSSSAITEGCTCGTAKPRKLKLLDNICPSCQLTRKAGKADSVKDGDVASNKGFTFGTYHEAQTVTVRPEAKVPRFQRDKETDKAKKLKTKQAEGGKVLKVPGLSPEYDTRGSGTVYPMSGLGNVTYKEQTENKYNSTAEVTRKSFSKFRVESIDSPSTEMGVTGGQYGPSNKEPMGTLNKIPTNLKKKTKK
jgi:predicted kinase